MKLTFATLQYLGYFLESFLFGLYSGIFGLHLLCHARNKGTDNTKQKIVFHALWVLYVLSTAVISLDIALLVDAGFINDLTIVLRLDDCQIILFGCCDFISQSILIYRCWIVWNRKISVVIIPSILTFAYFVMWIAPVGSNFIVTGSINVSFWGYILAVTALAASMTVNGLVTGLMVLKIYKVFRVGSNISTSEERSIGITGGGKLRSIIFVLIESAMALFAIQLARLIMVIIVPRLDRPDTAILTGVYSIIVSIHEMLNGITPTIILVRVSMGFSFHDKPSVEESIDSIRFATDDRNPMPGNGSIDSMDGLAKNLHADDLISIPIPLEARDITEEGRDLEDWDFGSEK